MTVPFRLPISLLTLVLCAACSRSAKTADEAGTAKGGATESADATPVQVEKVSRETIHRIVSAEAVLYPIKQANIVPKISAPVQSFLVQRGDHVHEGQLLATLEGRDLKAASEESQKLYEQAEASYHTTSAATIPDDLTKANADVAATKSALDAAQRVYESRESLFRQGALARKLVDDGKVALVQAQSQYDTARQHLNSLQTVGRTEQLRGAEAQRDAAKAHYQSAAAQASYTEIRSPINGTVSDRPLNIGEMASSGSALFLIVDISRLVARANVPVHEAEAIRVGRPASIATAGGKITGKVTVVSPAVDANTTTVQVWVEAPNVQEQLKPGATATILIQAGDIPNATVVPSAALLSSDEGGEKVMVAGSDGLAHERPVKVGVREDDKVQILSGVNAGESVVTVGGLGLDDKAKIEIQKATEEDSGKGTKEPGGKDDTK